jgi:protein associated with RNAse G/E
LKKRRGPTRAVEPFKKKKKKKKKSFIYLHKNFWFLSVGDVVKSGITVICNILNQVFCLLAW